MKKKLSAAVILFVCAFNASGALFQYTVPADTNERPAYLWIPPQTELVRATFPIEVKVVACHFGSGVEPEIRTAAPVEQVFNIIAAE